MVSGKSKPPRSKPPPEPRAGSARGVELVAQAAALTESDTPAAAKLAHEGARFAAATGDKLTQARGERIMAVCALLGGHPLDALAHARSALQKFRALGDAQGEVASLLALGGIYAQMLMSGRAIPYFEKCIALAAARGIIREQLFARNNLAHVLLALGRYDECLIRLEENIALARTHRMPAVEQFAVYRRAVIHWIRLDHEAAARDADAALRLARAEGNDLRVGESERLLGEIALSRGRVREAAPRLEAALAAGRRADNVVLLVYALCGLATVALRTDDRARARTLLREADRRAGAASDPHLAAMVEEGWGRLALAAGEPARALEHAKKSLALARELGYRDQMEQSNRLLADARAAVKEFREAGLDG